MQISPPTAMMEEQRDCLAKLAALHESFRADERLLATDLQGGMQWRRVDGHEYLTRYWPDPGNRSRKKTKTLGRRSPETERLFADFVARREEAQRRIEAAEPRVAMLGRAARGMGLARLSVTHARHLRRLAQAGFLDDPNVRLVVFGAPAFALYEGLYGYLAPPRLLRHDDGDDAATFYVGVDRIDDALAGKLAHALFTLKARVSIERHSAGCVSVHTLDQSDVSYREVDFVARRAVEMALSARSARPATVNTVFAGLDGLPLVKGLSVATDTSVVDYLAPDPRAFAMAARLVANGGSNPRIDDMIAFRRASAVAWNIRDQIIPMEFAKEQEDALADLGCPNPFLGYDPTFGPSSHKKYGKIKEARSSTEEDDCKDDRLKGP